MTSFLGFFLLGPRRPVWPVQDGTGGMDGVLQFNIIYFELLFNKLSKTRTWGGRGCFTVRRRRGRRRYCGHFGESLNQGGHLVMMIIIIHLYETDDNDDDDDDDYDDYNYTKL